MRQVFISYSHTDKLRAEELARHLRHSGVRVFLDLWGIGIGERIANVISDALNASSTVIVLATRESLSKQWVEAELDSALNLGLKGSCRLLVVKLEPCLLPTLIQGKRYLEVHDHWTRDSLKQLEIACEPNIHRNGQASWGGNFAGDGGSAENCLLEQGIPFYRVTLHLKHQGSYAGAFWEVTRGAVNVANSTSFTCKMRGASDSHGRLQIKFETQDGWPVYYAPFPPRQWKSIGPLRLTQVGAADWSRLERITIAADDRDLACGADHVVDVADFFFHYESEPPIETPNKTLNPTGNKPAS